MDYEQEADGMVFTIRLVMDAAYGATAHGIADAIMDELADYGLEELTVTDEAPCTIVYDENGSRTVKDAA